MKFKTKNTTYSSKRVPQGGHRKKIITNAIYIKERHKKIRVYGLFVFDLCSSFEQ